MVEMSRLTKKTSYALDFLLIKYFLKLFINRVVTNSMKHNFFVASKFKNYSTITIHRKRPQIKVGV